MLSQTLQSVLQSPVPGDGSGPQKQYRQQTSTVNICYNQYMNVSATATF